MNRNEQDACIRRLQENLRVRAPELQKLFELMSGLVYEDRVYRFYHQSFKVFHVQYRTEEIVQVLQSLLPDRPLNNWFMQIVREGTGKEFDQESNDHWLETTRPILEAFFHARFFLEMACRYTDTTEENLYSLPSGWAALLYLFQLR